MLFCVAIYSYYISLRVHTAHMWCVETSRGKFNFIHRVKHFRKCMEQLQLWISALFSDRDFLMSFMIVCCVAYTLRKCTFGVFFLPFVLIFRLFLVLSVSEIIYFYEK